MPSADYQRASTKKIEDDGDIKGHKFKLAVDIQENGGGSNLLKTCHWTHRRPLPASIRS